MMRIADVPVAQAFRSEGVHGGYVVANGTETLTPEGVSYRAGMRRGQGMKRENVGAPTFPFWNYSTGVTA